MFRQFRVAATGLNALEKELLTITNNVSNVETNAFKRSRVEFENIFPEILQEVLSETETDQVRPSAIEYGSGVRVAATTKDMSTGTISVTNNPLDLAIKGDGFFKVTMPDGSVAYTRSGNFTVDSTGRIVDVNGHPLDPEITIPETMTTITINTSGAVYVTENNQLTQTQVGQLDLIRFQNPAGLVSMGDNLYTESVASGSPISGIPGEQGFGEVAQFSLEASNVNIIQELTRMIMVQRAFDIVSKSVQSGEAMLNSAIEIARS